MKTVYIVDYWLPFPSSEYGGVDIVIADDKAEALELLAKAEKEWEYNVQDYPDHRERIAKSVLEARKFKVEAERSEIVFTFHT